MRYFVKSVSFALQGFYSFFRYERNGKTQGIIGFGVIIAGWVFQLERVEWLIILLCIGAVISLEMLNSAIERVCNLYSTAFHPQIKLAKDMAAAAVLWMTLVATVIGLLIFLPYVKQILPL